MSSVELKQSMEETLKTVEESVVDYLLTRENQYYFDSLMGKVEALLANLTNKANGIQGKSQFKDFLDFFFNDLIVICLKYSKDVVSKQDIEAEVVRLMSETVNKVLRHVDDTEGSSESIDTTDTEVATPSETKPIFIAQPEEETIN